MRTIEATATVTEDGKLTVQVSGITPGEHQVVVVIDERPVRRPYTPLKLNVGRLGGWPADCTFRREDLYGDDGR